MAQTVRISQKSDSIIQEMIKLTGLNKVEVIESALESYRHYERMRHFNDSFAHLRSQSDIWEEEIQERTVLEGTLGDGFEEE